MLMAKGEGIQDNWNLRINASVYQWTGDMLEEHERRAKWKIEAEHSDVQTVNPEHQSWVSSEELVTS